MQKVWKISGIDLLDKNTSLNYRNGLQLIFWGNNVEAHLLLNLDRLFDRNLQSLIWNTLLQ